MDCSNCQKYESQKPPLGVDEQLNLLKKRELTINNHECAALYLVRIGYTRLRPYWHHLEEDHFNHSFITNAKFEDIVKLYKFDEELRAAAFIALARIEVGFRSSWVNVLATGVGTPYGYLQKGLYYDQERFERDVASLEELWRKHQKLGDPLVRHYVQTYCRDCPPIWLAGEIMTFGLLSRFYANTKREHPAKRQLADAAGLRPVTLEKVSRAVAVFRNHVSHHVRIWDRKFATYPIPKRMRYYPDNLKRCFHVSSERWQQSSYTYFCLITHLEAHLGHESNFGWRVLELVREYDPPKGPMGMPDDFESRLIWNI